MEAFGNTAYARSRCLRNQEPLISAIRERFGVPIAVKPLGLQTMRIEITLDFLTTRLRNASRHRRKPAMA